MIRFSLLVLLVSSLSAEPFKTSTDFQTALKRGIESGYYGRKLELAHASLAQQTRLGILGRSIQSEVAIEGGRTKAYTWSFSRFDSGSGATDSITKTETESNTASLSLSLTKMLDDGTSFSLSETLTGSSADLLLNKSGSDPTEAFSGSNYTYLTRGVNNETRVSFSRPIFGGAVLQTNTARRLEELEWKRSRLSLASDTLSAVKDIGSSLINHTAERDLLKHDREAHEWLLLREREIEAKLQMGEVAEAELESIRLSVREAELSLSLSGAAYIRSAKRLAWLMGVREEDLPEVHWPVYPDYEEGMRALGAYNADFHPDVEIAKLGLEENRMKEEQARHNARPDASLNMAGVHSSWSQNSFPDDSGLGYEASVSVNWTPDRRSAKASLLNAKYASDEAELDYNKTRMEVLEQYEVARAELERAVSGVQILRARILQAKKQHSASVLKYERGLVGIRDLATSYESLAGKRRELINQKRALALAWLEVEAFYHFPKLAEGKGQ